jgi:uncharacterized protein YndB with AHSA1/START domain
MPTSTGRTLDHQYFVRASAKRVFTAISDPRELTQWLCDTATIEPRVGGPYALGWTDGPTHTGTVLRWRPGRAIALSWSWPGVPLKGTVFSLSVRRRERGSLLRVQHTGFPRAERWTPLYTGAEWGWTYFAMNLKSVLETGRDLRSPLDG